MDDKITIRASSLGGYLDCMVRAIAKNFRQVVQNAGYELATSSGPIVSSFIGTAVHAAVSTDLETIKNGTKRHSSNDLSDLASETFDDKIHGADVPTRFDDTTPNRDHAHFQINQMCKAHYLKVAPMSRPILVEQRLWCNLGSRVVLSGRPDSVEDIGTIQDVKTGRKSNAIYQMGGYDILAEANGIEIKNAEIVGIPRVKKGKAIEVYRDKISTEVLKLGAVPAIFRMVDSITDAIDEVSDGNPIYQANPASMFCGPKFCPAHGTEFCVATYTKGG